MDTLRIERLIEKCVQRYDPPIAAQLSDARRRLRKLFRRGFELVYDNYNALVFAFGPTQRASEVVLSIAGYPRWVTLFFLRGATLADPLGLLEGSGSQVRGIRLATAKEIGSRPIRALIAEAMEPAKAAFAAAEALETVIRAVSKKQRTRRPVAAVSRPLRTQSKVRGSRK